MMDSQNHNSSAETIEKNDRKSAEKCVNYAENEDDLLKIIAEIILKETADDFKRKDISKQTEEQVALLPELLDLPGIFERATINQQHSILNRVFKQGLIYQDGAFRTPWVNPAFAHNCLILKQKRLLFCEQPLEDFTSIPFCGELGFRTLCLYALETRFLVVFLRLLYE